MCSNAEYELFLKQHIHDDVLMQYCIEPMANDASQIARLVRMRISYLRHYLANGDVHMARLYLYDVMTNLYDFDHSIPQRNVANDLLDVWTTELINPRHRARGSAAVVV